MWTTCVDSLLGIPIHILKKRRLSTSHWLLIDSKDSGLTIFLQLLFAPRPACFSFLSPFVDCVWGIYLTKSNTKHNTNYSKQYLSYTILKALKNKTKKQVVSIRRISTDLWDFPTVLVLSKYYKEIYMVCVPVCGWRWRHWVEAGGDSDKHGPWDAIKAGGVFGWAAAVRDSWPEEPQWLPPVPGADLWRYEERWIVLLRANIQARLNEHQQLCICSVA